MASLPAPIDTTGALAATQLRLDEAGTPLSAVTFVVVDLETTGGQPAEGGITEIGAVAVRGGEVLGEFATLVNPHQAIPPMVARLTGIDDRMLRDAPSVRQAVLSFWEFARDAVIVAHNAPYDLGFLRGAGAQADIPWRQPIVIDTVTLARRVLTAGEVPNRKLATLARYFNSPTEPVHRALADARATVTVLHALLERLGPRGVFTLEDLLALGSQPLPIQQRKRSLADGLPDEPGVYIFRDDKGRPLYVGTSQNIRTRVRSYFTASQPRARMKDMLHQADSITSIVCATVLESSVREIRLIGEHQPPFNRRSKSPQRGVWVALSGGKSPRVTLTSRLGPRHVSAIGPYPTRHLAEAAWAAVRYCLSTTPDGVFSTQSTALTPEQHTSIQAVLQGDTTQIVAQISSIIDQHVAADRYERAAQWRDRLAALLWGVQSAHVLTSMATSPQITAGQLVGHTWHLHVIRYGQLAAAGTAKPGTNPREVLDALIAIGEDTPAPAGSIPRPAGLIEEARLVWRWLTRPDSRLVTIDHPLSTPLAGGGSMLHRLRAAQTQDTTLLAELDRLSGYDEPASALARSIQRRRSSPAAPDSKAVRATRRWS